MAVEIRKRGWRVKPTRSTGLALPVFGQRAKGPVRSAVRDDHVGFARRMVVRDERLGVTRKDRFGQRQRLKAGEPAVERAHDGAGYCKRNQQEGRRGEREERPCLDWHERQRSPVAIDAAIASVMRSKCSD